MDAVKTLWERCVDAAGTLLGRCVHAITGKCGIFAAIPQRADMVFERCTNAVATPFGVTGALQKNLNVIEY